jgi:alkylation response protein AidB-like acyl-CoA dehydrogenase
LTKIREGAVERDINRGLPTEVINELKETGFGALRVPTDYFGFGTSLPEFFALLIELGEADSNIAQALRGHFAFVEDLLNFGPTPFAERWLTKVGNKQTVGNAMAEIGPKAMQQSLATRLTGTGETRRIDGSKYYTTGSLYADWVEVSADDDNGQPVIAMVARHEDGVEIVDDWDGFGQTLTASGSAHFKNVKVEAQEVRPLSSRFGYATAFFQLYHLATIAGVGRAVTGDTARLVAARTRVYSHGAGSRSSNDPQILQLIGQMRGAAYAAGAIVMQVARSLQRAADLAASGDQEAAERAYSIVELETAQAQTVVIDLVLDAATKAFDTLGASSTKKDVGLDRHWRNVRTIACHNPRVYKQRIVGDYAVNGTAPPFQWVVGAV